MLARNKTIKLRSYFTRPSWEKLIESKDYTHALTMPNLHWHYKKFANPPRILSFILCSFTKIRDSVFLQRKLFTTAVLNSRLSRKGPIKKYGLLKVLKYALKTRPTFTSYNAYICVRSSTLSTTHNFSNDAHTFLNRSCFYPTHSPTKTCNFFKRSLQRWLTTKVVWCQRFKCSTVRLHWRKQSRNR